MIFSYNWLKSFFDDKFPDIKTLTQALTMRAFEVEDVEKKGEDWAMDISVLPNRGADCLSHIGMAREIGAIGGGEGLGDRGNWGERKGFGEIREIGEIRGKRRGEGKEIKIEVKEPK